jgi:hypothetical protein
MNFNVLDKMKTLEIIDGIVTHLGPTYGSHMSPLDKDIWYSGFYIGHI